MTPPGQIEALLRAAEEHHRAGRLPQARDIYRQALAARPRDAHALHMLGVISLQYDDPQAASGPLREAAEAQPDSAQIRANLGYALLRLGGLDEAMQHLRAAIALDPRHVLAHNNLGNALAQLGRDEEAIACYRAAAAAAPRHAQSHYNLGVALRAWGELGQAAAGFQAALALNPDFAEAHNALGALRQEIGMLQEAEASLRAALRARPDYAEAYFNLHAVLLDLSGAPAALRCLERALQVHPQPHYHFFLGMLLDHAGDEGAARAHLEAASRGAALEQARLDAWRYLRAAAPRPALAGGALRVFRTGLEAARRDGLVLEFGVRFGTTIRQIAALAHQEVHGFDSFEGLPEPWHEEPKGAYSTGGVLPPVPPNVRLHAGWFEDSLPRFLASHAGPVRFVNVDCDLYSSTRTVLRHLAGRVAPGTVMVFDEYLGYEQWREDEFRAFQEALREHGWRYEYLCFSFFTKQAAVRIL